MCYDVYYHLVKFQLKIPHMHEEIKKTNCIRTKGHSLRCKINQTIVYGVIQTFAIVQKSNLDFFLLSLNLMQVNAVIIMLEKILKNVGCAIHATKKLDESYMPSREFFMTYMPIWTGKGLTVTNGEGERLVCPSSSWLERIRCLPPLVSLSPCPFFFFLLPQRLPPSFARGGVWDRPAAAVMDGGGCRRQRPRRARPSPAASMAFALGMDGGGHGLPRRRPRAGPWRGRRRSGAAPCRRRRTAGSGARAGVFHRRRPPTARTHAAARAAPATHTPSAGGARRAAAPQRRAASAGSRTKARTRTHRHTRRGSPSRPPGPSRPRRPPHRRRRTGDRRTPLPRTRTRTRQM